MSRLPRPGHLAKKLAEFGLHGHDPNQPPLARYVVLRQCGSGAAYYWHVPKRTRPDIQIRALSLGTDRAAANAVAERMLRDADAKRPLSATDPLAYKTELAREFAHLDAASRQRALTDAESERLEKVMIDLRMIEL